MSFSDDMDFDIENRMVDTEYTSEDRDTEFSLRPHTLTEYIGQEKAKEILKIYIDAAIRESLHQHEPINVMRLDWPRAAA